MTDSLTLVSNPGSTSRKYVFYKDLVAILRLHIEQADGGIVCTIETQNKSQQIKTGLDDVSEASEHIMSWAQQHGSLDADIHIDRIGLRVVAPGEFFLADHIVDESVVQKLEQARSRAPLHIRATLDEYYSLHAAFPAATIVCVSDSLFHITKPDYAWNYGLPLDISDKLELKRFGYHGLSVSSIVRSLNEHNLMLPKVIVCHIGGGVSVTALHHGKSIDTTMGYSPLDGTIMATRSGSVDWPSIKVLSEHFSLDPSATETFLNTQCGLEGLGGSSDVRELLEREAAGDRRAHLALDTYIYSLQKSIGQMVAALGGIDAIVLTGTIGERSAPVRSRLLRSFNYLHIRLDEQKKNSYMPSRAPTDISKHGESKAIYALQTDESYEIAHGVAAAYHDTQP